MQRRTFPHWTLAGLTAFTLVMAAVPASAAFTLSNPGGSWSSIYGQSFSPSVEPVADPGLSPTDAVYLTSFTFTSSGQGAGAAQTYMAILPGAYYDTNGDPDGSFTPTVSDAVGISTNSIDTTTAATNDVLSFDFNNLALTYGDNYAAAFVTLGGGDELTFIAVSALTVNYVEVTAGDWHPDTNYGGEDNFDAATFWGIAADGYMQAYAYAGDANFTATFDVPEPATAALCLIGTAALGLGRRRRDRTPA